MDKKKSQGRARFLIAPSLDSLCQEQWCLVAAACDEGFVFLYAVFLALLCQPCITRILNALDCDFVRVAG